MQVSNLVYAFAKLGHQPAGSLLANLAQAAAKHISGFTAQASFVSTLRAS